MAAVRVLLIAMLTGVLYTAHTAAGSKIEFGSSPAVILDGLTDTVTLRCEIKDTSASSSVVGKRDVTQTTENVGSVTSIIIMRNGKDIASVGEFTAAHVMDVSVNTQVTGSVSKTQGENGFIELNILNPTVSQIGEYVCEANALSQAGHGIIFSTSIELTNSTPTMADLISYIHNLKQKVSQLEQSVLFSVALTNSATIPAGGVVLYNEVFSNVGNGFNISSGQFVCPVAGFYQFEIHALNQHNANFWLDLKQNSVTTISIHGARADYQGSSNSAILKVEKGDVLKVVALHTSSVYDAGISQAYTTCSGHLLQVA